MKHARNFILIFLLFILIDALLLFLVYKPKYKMPRIKNAQAKANLNFQIQYGKTQLQKMNQTVQQFGVPFYTRSLPTNLASAQTEYQIWLTQMADFCGMSTPMVALGKYQMFNGVGTLRFQLKAECSMSELYQFLYEFYWTSYLHYIASMDVQPLEKSDKLAVNLIIEGLTLAKLNPNQAYPLAQQLPLSTPYRRLSSGPFQAYAEVAKEELFRYTKPGIDNANFALLTGTPISTEESTGKSIAYCRWKIETEGRTMTLKVNDKISIGSFDGTVADIFEDMVVLRRNNNSLWVVSLGEKLSDAVAIPPNLF